jgi:hypothetical protein
MNRSRIYEVRIEGMISDRWSDWFEGLEIQPTSTEQETLIKGELPDQAALLGVLSKIHSLNLKIVSVVRVI